MWYLSIQFAPLLCLPLMSSRLLIWFRSVPRIAVEVRFRRWTLGRQQVLRHRYFFDCACNLCSLPEDALGGRVPTLDTVTRVPLSLNACLSKRLTAIEMLFITFVVCIYVYAVCGSDCSLTTALSASFRFDPSSNMLTHFVLFDFALCLFDLWLWSGRILKIWHCPMTDWQSVMSFLVLGLLRLPTFASGWTMQLLWKWPARGAELKRLHELKLGMRQGCGPPWKISALWRHLKQST